MKKNKEPTKDEVRKSLKIIEVSGQGDSTLTSDTPTTGDSAFRARNLGVLGKDGTPIVKGSRPPAS